MSLTGPIFETLRRSSAGAALLEITESLADVHVVGGTVRDSLLGLTPREIDLVVEGQIDELVEGLAARFSGSVTYHDRFGTATVEVDQERVDVAQARTELYRTPGDLPEVNQLSGVSIDDDLLRRDFTINAIAVQLSQPGRGTLRAASNGYEDLVARQLRVLHDDSFRDDPTRLLRLARYVTRLGFEPEPHTRSLVKEAVGQEVMRKVSAARIGAELRLLLAESDPLSGLDCLDRLGLLEDIASAAAGSKTDPQSLVELAWDRQRAKDALSLLPVDGDKAALLVAICLVVAARNSDVSTDLDTLRTWLDGLEFPTRQREAIVSAVIDGPLLADRLAEAQCPSEIASLLSGKAVEAVCIAGALRSQDRARRWLAELRHVKLEITGDDLVAAGIEPGPGLGKRLSIALARKLDGELRGGRAVELAFALNVRDIQGDDDP